jgi:hypothetical protein
VWMWLLVLGFWAAFLASQAVRWQDQRRAADSIGAFRSHLSVLERARPAGVSNVRLLHTAVPAGGVGGVAVPPARARRPLEPVVSPSAPSSVREGAPAGPVRRPRPPRPSASVRMRRIFILRRLLVAMALTLVLGLVPPLRFLLVAHLLFAALFVAYLAALVRVRAAAVERAEKVHYLQARPAEPVQASGVIVTPMRRTAASG